MPNRPQPARLAETISTLYQTWASNRALAEARWQTSARLLNREDDATWKAKEGEDWRSTRYIAIARQKILSCAGLIKDSVLADGRWPIFLEGETRAPLDARGNPMADRDPTRPLTDRIDHLLQLCDADRELYRCLVALLTYGESYMRWYVYQHTDREWVQGVPDAEAAGQLEGAEVEAGAVPVWMQAETVAALPGVSYVSPWDVFRDLDTDDLQAGVGVICRRWVSSRDLRGWLEGGDPNVCREGVALVLDRLRKTTTDAGIGSTTTQDTPMMSSIQRHRATEMLEYWGRVPRAQAEEFARFMAGGEADASATLTGDDERPGDEAEVHACLVDGVVVRFCPCPDGERPFYRAVCEYVPDSPFGYGVGDAVAGVQSAFNGAVRAVEDNMRLTGNAMFATNPEWVRGAVTFYPGATIKVHPDCPDVRQAVQQFQFADVSGGLLNYITLLSQFSDDESMVPKVSQGVPLPGKQPNTATEINALTTNSGRYIGMIVHHLDEGIIEPVGDAFYRWLMESPDVPDEEKLPARVTARGAKAFQDRVLRLAKLTQFLSAAAGSEAMSAEINWQEAVLDFAQMADVDGKRLLKTDEQRKAEAEARAADQGTRLQLAELQARVEKLLADAEARRAGVDFDAQMLRLKQAELANRIVQDGKRAEAAPPSGEVSGEEAKREASPGQGPYRERGAGSNNERGG